jgi:cation:H+ antiporter
MSLRWAVGLFVGGLVLVIGAFEQLVESTVGLSRSVGLSSFLISVVLIGFDPENLAVGAVASYGEAAGLVMGTIVGAAMVALALAFGVTAVIVPLTFDRAPRRILTVPVAAVGL